MPSLPLQWDRLVPKSSVYFLVSSFHETFPHYFSRNILPRASLNKLQPVRLKPRGKGLWFAFPAYLCIVISVTSHVCCRQCGHIHQQFLIVRTLPLVGHCAVCVGKLASTDSKNSLYYLHNAILTFQTMIAAYPCRNPPQNCRSMIGRLL